MSKRSGRKYDQQFDTKNRYESDNYEWVNPYEWNPKEFEAQDLEPQVRLIYYTLTPIVRVMDMLARFAGVFL